MEYSHEKISFRLSHKDKIMPLNLFNVWVPTEDYRQRRLQVTVSQSGEILFAASQWLGAAMGCSDAKNAGDKVQDIIRKLPDLRHAAGGLGELTSINVSQK
jgi:hypothetical protein